jgi:hypothetical protein
MQSYGAVGKIAHARQYQAVGGVNVFGIGDQDCRNAQGLQRSDDGA